MGDTHTKEKVVLVTGSNRGIGLATAKKFDREGYSVILHGRGTIHDDVLSQFKNVINVVSFDITDKEKIFAELERIECDLPKGKIDFLINAAGVNKDYLFTSLNLQKYQKVFNTNLLGTVNVTEAVLTKMSTGSSIVHISSIVAEKGNIGQYAYGVSKAALIDFSNFIALKYAGKSIRSNVIAPGMIQSDMTEQLPGKVRNELIAKIPLRRFGEVNEVANIIVSVAENTYTTGSVININGGLELVSS